MWANLGGSTDCTDPSSKQESDLTLNSTEKKVVSSEEGLLSRDGVTPGLYILPSNLLLS